MAKQEERKVIKLVRKSNHLVEARYRFDIWETRIFTKMLTMISKEDEDFRNYRIYLGDVVKDFELENSNSSYERLKEGGIKLMRKLIKVIVKSKEGHLEELTTPIVIGMKNPLKMMNKQAKYIDISFHPDMKPFLLSLKSQFTTYDVQNILKLPSSYSIRIYELLKQYESIGQRRFNLKQLKEIIGVIEETDTNGKKEMKDIYPKFGNFRQRVLNKAQRDLQRYTDITFDFETVKKGRRIEEILFFIHSNVIEPIEVTDDTKEEIIIGSSVSTKNNQQKAAAIYEKVKQWINYRTVEKWLKEYPISQIEQAINYTLNQLNSGVSITNIAGYLQTMVKQETIIDTQQKIKENKKNKKEQQQLQFQFREDLERERRALYKGLSQQKDKVIQQLLKANPNVERQIIQALKQKTLSFYNDDLSLANNLKNPPCLAAFRNVVEELYPAEFKELFDVYHPKIEAINKQLSQL